MKPSEICKSAGFTLAEVSKTTSVSIQTLNNWHKNKPALFKTIVAGVAALKENGEKLHDLVQRNPDVGCWVEKETDPATGDKTWHGYKDKSEYDKE